jgi:hypothetical protein
MVADVSKLDATTIWWDLDLVPGMQFVAIWHESRGISLQAGSGSTMNVL